MFRSSQVHSIYIFCTHLHFSRFLLMCTQFALNSQNNTINQIFSKVNKQLIWYSFSDIFYVNIIKLGCDISVLVSIPLLFVGIAQVSDHSLFPMGPIINHVPTPFKAKTTTYHTTTYHTFEISFKDKWESPFLLWR